MWFRFIVTWVESIFPGSKAVIEKYVNLLRDDKLVVFAILETLKKYTPDSVDSFIDVLEESLKQVLADGPMRAKAMGMVSQATAEAKAHGESPS